MKSLIHLLSMLQLRFKSVRIVGEALLSTTPADDSPFLRLGWALDPGPPTVADWLEENRVQGHTRLSISLRTQLDSEEFENAAAQMKELGAGVFTRHVKTCFESPWWPTETPPLWNGKIQSCIEGRPEISIPEGVNVVRDMVDEAHREELPLIAYYRHMSESRLSTLYPDWVCKEPDCETVIHNTRRAPWLDLTVQDYREIVRDRLLELAGLGVDGFFFDHRHMPIGGCWCTALEAAFTEVTGQSPPKQKKLANQLYRQFIDFQAYKVEETFAYWSKEVKHRYPHVVFIISTDGMSVPSSRHKTTNLIRLADSAKNEYKQALLERLYFPLEEVPDDPRSFFEQYDLAEPPPDIRQAFGWVMLRDLADGRPPHIWERGFPNHDHTYAATAAMLTYGAVANMNVAEAILANETPGPIYTTRDNLVEAFALGNAVSGHLANSRPLRWAAIHFSELTRNRRECKPKETWQEVLWPALGAFGVFAREGLPIGIVNDYQLERNQLAGYQVLFIPNPRELSSAQKQALRQFVARGGILLKNNPAWPWSDPQSTHQAWAALRTEVRRVRQCSPPPIHVLASVEKLHAVAFAKEQRLMVAVTNDFSWVQWNRRREDEEPLPGEDGEPLPAPPPVRDAQLLVNNRPLPSRIFEAISGAELVAVPTSGGYKVHLPEFPFMAFVVVEA